MITDIEGNAAGGVVAKSSTTANIIAGDILEAHVAVGVVTAVKIGEGVGVAGRCNSILSGLSKRSICFKG